MPQTKQRANYLLRCSDGYADVVPGTTMQLEQKEIEKMADILTPVLLNRIKATTRILVGVRDIERMCGFAKDSSAVRIWLSDPTFPAPCGASRSRRWFLSDVLQWLKDKQTSASDLAIEVSNV